MLFFLLLPIKCSMFYFHHEKNAIAELIFKFFKYWFLLSLNIQYMNSVNDFLLTTIFGPRFLSSKVNPKSDPNAREKSDGLQSCCECYFPGVPGAQTVLVNALVISHGVKTNKRDGPGLA